MLTSDFNDVTAVELPDTDFVSYLISQFDRETALKVKDAFHKMNLLMPETAGEFMQGGEGGLVFLNNYGVLIRIEYKDSRNTSSGWISDRINDSPWVLQPLASIDAGKAVIEICPGCHAETGQRNVKYVRRKLNDQNVEYWDRKPGNNGLLPLATPHFPKGVPVVIDRLAVRKLTEDIGRIRKAFRSFKAFFTGGKLREAAKAQETLYGPLRQSFAQGWTHAAKMKQFWELCRASVLAGQLIGGWNEIKDDEMSNAAKAARAAKQYEIRLNGGTPVPAIKDSTSPRWPG